MTVTKGTKVLVEVRGVAVPERAWRVPALVGVKRVSMVMGWPSRPLDRACAW